MSTATFVHVQERYICAICAKSDSEVRATESPVTKEELAAEVTLHPSGHVEYRVPRGPKQQDVHRHVWITEDEFLDGKAGLVADRKKEAANLAEQTKKDDEKRKVARETYDFVNAAQNRMERAWLQINYEKAGWSMRNPPVMMVLKSNGQGWIKNWTPDSPIPANYWPERHPTHTSYTDDVKEFIRIMKLGFGEFNALQKNEFASVGNNPHTMFLTCKPLDAFGREIVAQFNPDGKYKKWRGMRWEDCFIVVWGHVSEQVADISGELGKGKIAWVATKEEEIRPLDSILDHVERYIDYSRKRKKPKLCTCKAGKCPGKPKCSGVKKDKSLQNRMAPAWHGSGKQFSYWSTVGFTNMRRTDAEPLTFQARTPAAKEAVRRFLASCKDSQANTTDVDERDAYGVPTGNKLRVDVSMFGNGSHQGGMLHRKLTDGEIHTLRHLISYYNSRGVVLDEEDDDYSEPISYTTEFVKALMNSAPPWWERPGADRYLEGLLSDAD